jgi:CelD/BcsL family acetyltransferase involved in cellulose biosynthesis
MCERFAGAGRLALYELRAGSRTVAMKCNLIAPPGTFMFKIAHDEELGRFSPGVHLELASVEKFLESELQWMDSCADPQNQMINRLFPHRRELSTTVLVRGALRGLASRAGLASVAAIRERREPSTAT